LKERDMTEAEWLVCRETHPMLAHIGADVYQRKLRLLVAACFARVWDELPDACREWVVLLGEEVEGRGSPRELDDRWMDVVDYIQTRDEPIGGRLYSLLNLSTGSELGFWSSDYQPDRGGPGWVQAEVEYAELVREIFGNPFRPVVLSREWQTDTVLSLAQQMYDAGEFSAMPILADALQDAGCDNNDILDHCRGPGPHTRGCWVVDLVLGKG
jgi:hypothetical protein